ncbi:hypothetical protein GCM10007989_02150 [Devosia pacifica]|uniref:Uncharacterized protein n=1 Tax=Devosia pacifica TaxID=1335967 RepID=A0A918RSR4_9HYPH|nr:hypothetical protein [Devosia pacifica]GHA11415.1 hypothetical protein GCM10007989_02150 [Devosia pacifica]
MGLVGTTELQAARTTVTKLRNHCVAGIAATYALIEARDGKHDGLQEDLDNLCTQLVGYQQAIKAIDGAIAEDVL